MMEGERARERRAGGGKPHYFSFFSFLISDDDFDFCMVCEGDWTALFLLYTLSRSLGYRWLLLPEGQPMEKEKEQEREKKKCWFVERKKKLSSEFSRERSSSRVCIFRFVWNI